MLIHAAKIRNNTETSESFPVTIHSLDKKNNHHDETSRLPGCGARRDDNPASCSSDDDAAQGGTQSQAKQRAEIAFATLGTRAANLQDLDEFQAWAFEHGSNAEYVPETTYTWDDDKSAYRSTPPYYWPVTGGNLDFYAMLPEGGTTAINGTSQTCLYTSWNGEGDPVAAVALNQASQDKVPLTFKHIMTKVSTSVTDHTESGFSLKVVDIKMTPKNGGTYTFGTSTGAIGSWGSLATTKAQHTYNYGNTTSCATYYIIIPQPSVSFTIQYYVFSGTTSGSLMTKTFDVDFSNEIGKQVTVNVEVKGRGPWEPDVEIKFTKTITDYVTSSPQGSSQQYI